MERQNITLSLPKSLLKQAKALAAREERSLSAFLKEALEEKIRRDTGYKEAMERQISTIEKGLNLGTGGRIPWSREDLHERR